ncbi:MAG: type II toxin-antitoxin system Phd/YefM family antitoxin [Nitrospirota bacterium]|nr:type II toxin-antitoxin system Phd/YefM family antitoxin [Nitrospirota bacterium]
MSASGLGIDRSVSVSEAKLASLVRRVREQKQIVALTHHGVPSAVLLSIDQYLGLIETAEILSDRKAMRSLRRSLKQAGKGEWVHHQEVFSFSANLAKKV